MFKGSNVALVTPFKNDKLDDETYIKLIHFHIKNGTNGLVPAGTTGESPTLSHHEHERVIELCVKESNGKLPVFAGTGSNSTEEAISLTRHAEKIGANGALIVTPYYNKPTQRGMYEHFESISKNSNIPIIIYNIPGRSVVNMTNGTMKELFKLKNIVGVKDATADIPRVYNSRIDIGEDFNLLTGDDATCLAFMLYGGHGSISVTANIAPKLCSDFMNFCLEGKFQEATRINDLLMPLHTALFIESSPGPVKYAASLLGLCNGNTRLPLSEINENTKKVVKNCLQELQLL